jgi:hypothetical protein
MFLDEYFVIDESTRTVEERIDSITGEELYKNYMDFSIKVVFIFITFDLYF